MNDSQVKTVEGELLSDKQIMPSSNALMKLSSYEDSLDAYLHQIAKIPLLSREDEVEYARRYRDHRDMQAAQYLVLSNLRFVVYVAKGFKGYGLPLADIIQEGNLGLMKAVEKFDPEQNVRFISYAVYWIRCDINEYIIKNMRMVRSITNKNRRKLLFNYNKHLGTDSVLSSEKREQLAKEYGVSQADIDAVEAAIMNHDASIEYATEGGIATAELLPDQSPTPEALLDAQSREDQHGGLVSKMLGSLNDRQRDIIKKRWLSSKKSSLEDLAKDYGVSMQRVSQIEKQALAKCREVGVPFEEVLLLEE